MWFLDYQSPFMLKKLQKLILRKKEESDVENFRNKCDRVTQYSSPPWYMQLLCIDGVVSLPKHELVIVA